MVHFIPYKETATAEDVAQLFLEHVWKLHVTPKQTVSDRGPTFNSKFLRVLYKALHIALSYSTAYHPQSDGQTEIKNQWLESYLHPFINHRQSDWVNWLPLAEFAHNNAKSKATGKSLFEIVYGRSPMISLALEPTGSPAADDRAKQLADTIQEVQASIKWAQERYKQADKGKQRPELAPGDKVWLLASNITS
ncbi:Retrotransposable element Tf2 155 kDa protein type 2 [Rhizoctonia solani AG-1 IB]|uniref:Retrotransposable element Tf2 155 kDa protein type 2 n=1 Tax=Thanatephorus cucumeris (strain AG1-IB / isolate 7/3/14) TaxID=1108050 RepID=M5C4M0_THACB|nr:Retrotransposable element Tf2 155 kDa protein type 2 [Rhizoctonia solani AG-1 IB]